MTLKGLYSKEETLKHGLLKWMCYMLCKRLGHDADVEFNAGKGIGIFDAVDWTSGLVYEPIESKSKKIRAKKIDKYLRYVGIRDVIFIETKDYSLDETVNTWIERLLKIIA